ncbi:MAG: hypothetical protein WCJ18_02730, partial [Planctomycetota bacterium]
MTDIRTGLAFFWLVGVFIDAAVADGPSPHLRPLAVRADPPIIVAAKGGGRATLTVQMTTAQDETFEWSQVPDRINPLRTKGRARLDGDGASVTAVLPESGVYQFMVVAKTGTATVARGTTWVQAWEDRGPLDRGPTLGTFPGVAPPTSVRHFSPLPAPFEHPRVLFTDADWPEMSHRARTGTVAGWGVKTIRQWVAETLDDPKTPTGRLAQDLDAWMQAGDKAKPPDLTALAGDAVLSSEARGVFYSMLLDAAYLLWLDHDPRVPPAKQPAAVRDRGHRLARIAAAAATLHFRTVWDRGKRTVLLAEGPLAVRGLADVGEPAAGPGLCDLALAYDLLFDWMNEPERLAVRDFLVATGYGRHTSGH